MADQAPVDGAAGDAAVLPTRYDRITYPSGVFSRVGPNRLQILARLHGIDAAPIETSRVLEIGGGDGLNLTAFAAAFPQSTCLSFDLSPTAVARGRTLAAAAGVTNIRIEQHDILDVAANLAGEYDYVIAHGVYAWVPAPVRAALLALVSRVLAPNGVTAISYNTLPGHVLGQTLRAMIQAEVGDERDDQVRFEKSMAALRAFSEGDLEGSVSNKEEAFIKTLRLYARELVQRPEALLAHDELGGCYEPQAFGAVCAAARAAGLTYLNDTCHKVAEQGFSGGTDQTALIRTIEVDDFRTMAFFRRSLFVRGGVPIERRLDLEKLETLWLSSSARMLHQGKFARGEMTFEVADFRASAIMREAERRYPARLPLAGLQPEQLETFCRLFLSDGISLSTSATSVAVLSERPRLSALTRAQIERGDSRIATLEQTMAFPSAEVCRFMLLFNGERDIAQLAEEAGVGVAEVTAIVNFIGSNALLVA